MTRDDIIKMAREAGFNPVSYTGANLELFERFAALVADSAIKPWADQLDAERKRFSEYNEMVVGAMQDVRRDEREACAKAVEDYCGAWDDEGYALATAIRSKGEK